MTCMGRCAVADYAARAGVPVVRFMPEGYSAEEFLVNQERPAALVFASEADAKRFHYVEEAPRIVLPLSRATSKNAQDYAEIPAALQAAKAGMQPATPPPSALQVTPLLILYVPESPRAGRLSEKQMVTGTVCCFGAADQATPISSAQEEMVVIAVRICRQQSVTPQGTVPSARPREPSCPGTSGWS